MAAKAPRLRLLVFNDPHTMRIDKDLAAEIGLNESILFLQIEYLIGLSQHEQDGRLWTYQSLQDLHDNFFPWWSLMTISRIIKTLQSKNLLIVGNYNKSGFDRTQWFALNEEGISRLESVKLQVSPIYQNGKWISQNGEIDPNKMVNRSQQNDTTIPKTTTETTQSGGKRRIAAAADPDVVQALIECGQSEGQAERYAPLQEWTSDKLARLKQYYRVKSDDPRVQSAGGLIASFLKRGELPDDLPAPPPQELTEEEKEARYLANFYSKTVHPADYRR